ncbi:hypothetical protein [Rhizobium sp. SGZ-381]|uniref:hypothetical protein n=1 Tax=Rhizobium sp. SGZ-381 TaxID=3342800 RepID=UPI00366AC1D8
MIALLASSVGRRLLVAGAAVGLILAALAGVRLWLSQFEDGIRREERAACDRRIEEMVSLAEYDALSARMAEEARLRTAAEAAASAAIERSAGLSRMAAERAAALDARAAEAQSTPGLTFPSKEDLQWLAKPQR